MPTEQRSAFCPYCQVPVLAVRDAPNHVVHALITLFSCGLWLIVWALSTFVGRGDWACPTCGSKAEPR